MKHKIFALYCFAFMAFLFTVVGLLSIFGIFNAETSIWPLNLLIDGTPEKVVNTVLAFLLCILFLRMGLKEFRKLH